MVSNGHFMQRMCVNNAGVNCFRFQVLENDGRRSWFTTIPISSARDAPYFLSQEKESKLYFLYLIDEYIYKYNTS